MLDTPLGFPLNVLSMIVSFRSLFASLTNVLLEMGGALSGRIQEKKSGLIDCRSEVGEGLVEDEGMRRVLESLLEGKKSEMRV